MRAGSLRSADRDSVERRTRTATGRWPFASLRYGKTSPSSLALLEGVALREADTSYAASAADDRGGGVTGTGTVGTGVGAGAGAGTDPTTERGRLTCFALFHSDSRI